MVVLHEIKYESAATCPADLKKYAIKRNWISLIGILICVAAFWALMCYLWLVMKNISLPIFTGVFSLFFVYFVYVYVARISLLKKDRFGWKKTKVQVYMSQRRNLFGAAQTWPIKRYLRHTDVEGVGVDTEDGRLNNGDEVYLFEVFGSHLPDGYARFVLKNIK